MTASSSSRQEQRALVLTTDHLMADLGRRTAAGGIIGVAAQCLQLVAQIGAFAILGRLLVSDDFGLLAMAATVTALMGVFNDLGLSAATVQRKVLDQQTMSALFFVNLGAGVLLMLIAWTVAPVAAWFFDDERVLALVIALSAALPATAAAVQHRALLQRGMRWITIHWTGLTAQVLGAAVAILIAWRTDLGYWALVAQVWTSALVGLTLTWMVCPWRPTAVRGGLSETRWALRFGMNLSGFNLLNYFHRQLDDVLIGRRWGSADLGFYTQAYQILLLPLSLINGPIGAAAIPALSRLQDDPARWRRYFLDTMAVVTLVGSGIAAVMFATAKPLVAVVLGPGWDRAGEILGLLAVSMFAASPMNASGWIYVSLGRTNRMFVWGLIAAPFLVLSFVVGLPGGPEGVALSYSIAVSLLFTPCLLFATKGTPVTGRQLLRATTPFMLSSVFAVALGSAVTDGLLTSPSDLQYVIVTGTVVALFHLVLSSAVFVLDPRYNALKSKINNRRRSNRTTT